MMFICLIDDTISLRLPSSYTWKSQLKINNVHLDQNKGKPTCSFCVHLVHISVIKIININNIQLALYVNKFLHS